MSWGTIGGFVLSSSSMDSWEDWESVDTSQIAKELAEHENLVRANTPAAVADDFEDDDDGVTGTPPSEPNPSPSHESLPTETQVIRILKREHHGDGSRPLENMVCSIDMHLYLTFSAPIAKCHSPATVIL